MPYQPDIAHKLAAHRHRRTILHYDAETVATECGGLKAPEGMSLLDAYLLRLWEYVDQVIGQVDSIHWDACFSDQIAFCHRSSLPQGNPPVFRQLAEMGVDLYDEFIAGSRKRGLECTLVHRISGPETGGVEPLKLSHPEYYINDWTKLTNFAVPAMRQFKLDMLREDIITRYDFDGYEIDFCRHTPFLPPGHQWALREHVTQFMRDLRGITLAAEKQWGHPILLSARVPESAQGCMQDGLDLAVWADEQLVDTLTLGSRSFEVDIASVRAITGSSVKLFPCFDAHHQTDGYADPPAEVLNAVFSNWWAQGADGIAMFNLYACGWETHRKTAAEPFQEHTHALEQVLSIAGDARLLARQDKTYVVERRGGYPWENGFANNNNSKQLPRILGNDGACEKVSLQVGEPIAPDTQQVRLAVVAYGILPDDTLEITINGVPMQGARDDAWPDKQLRPLQPERVSGFHTDHLPEPEDTVAQARLGADTGLDTEFIPFHLNRMTRIVCDVAPGIVARGQNTVGVALRRGPRYPYLARAELERVELYVTHNR